MQNIGPAARGARRWLRRASKNTTDHTDFTDGREIHPGAKTSVLFVKSVVLLVGEIAKKTNRSAAHL
jgi:hypothetical protein